MGGNTHALRFEVEGEFHEAGRAANVELPADAVPVIFDEFQDVRPGGDEGRDRVC